MQYSVTILDHFMQLFPFSLILDMFQMKLIARLQFLIINLSGFVA